MPDRIMENGLNLNKQNIRFWVLIPVYNVEKYIRECIESVLNQTYQNFKLVLVDDGSIDCSGKICDDYALKDNRITVLHQENMGQLAARQTAIRHFRQLIGNNAKNDFLVFLDSDDSLKERALEKICLTIRELKCDMVVYGMDRVAEGKVLVPYDTEQGFEGLISDKRVLYKKVFNSSGYNPLCRKSISASLLPDLDYGKFYDVVYGEDLLQSIAYYKNCKKTYFLNESLYNYTINPFSITQTVNSSNFSINFTVRQNVFEFLLSENVFTAEDWKEYRSYCIRLLMGLVKTILQFDISTAEKINYFNKIWNSEYFSKYIYGKEFNKFGLGLAGKVYKLFERRRYRILICCGKLYNAARNLKKFGKTQCRKLKR